MNEIIQQTLERDLAGVIRRKMEEIYAPANQGRAGGGNAAQRDKADRDSRNAFIVRCSIYHPDNTY